MLASVAAAAFAAGLTAVAKQTEPPPANAAAPPSTVSGVTVTAPGKTNPLVDPTTQFVRQHLPESDITEQYPRFGLDICVKVVGLPQGFDDFVARRVVEM
ncbi:MAG TPA: hypothetical protein VFW13_00020, partial [Phenylobacterium sp.]|nr:hypothetical protein [Phenylobacterium sp.]